MSIVSLFRLFRECFLIGGSAGLIACCKYLSGRFLLPELDEKVRISEVRLSLWTRQIVISPRICIKQIWGIWYVID